MKLQNVFQIILPMGGRGSRYVKAGYTTIKPLVPIDGKPMVAHAVGHFPGESDFLFVCARDHLEQTSLRTVLDELAPRSYIASIEPHSQGPVCSALEARALIRDNVPVVLSYCNFSLHWDYARFKTFVEKTGCAGCLVAYRGYQPLSGTHVTSGYLLVEGDRVRQVRSKSGFSTVPNRDWISAGVFYFQSGDLLKKYFQAAVDGGLKMDCEFYASLPFNLMIRDGLDVRVFEVENYLDWSAPENLSEYHLWSDHFSKYSEWKPQRLSSKAVCLFPVPRPDRRETEEGFDTARAFSPLDGKPLLERALRLPSTGEHLVITPAGESMPAEVRDAVRSGRHAVRAVQAPMGSETFSALCLAASGYVDPRSPLFLCSADTLVAFDEARWEEALAETDKDFWVWSFRNYPKANQYPKSFGWITLSAKGLVTGVSRVPTLGRDLKKEPGLAHVLWLRQASLLFDTVRDSLPELNFLTTDHQWDALLVSLAARARGGVFDTSQYLRLARMADFQAYEYWARFFRRSMQQAHLRQTA